MTREEAAKRLREIGVKFALFSLRGTEELSLNAEALNIAIEELKRESCDDCISRQDTLAEFKRVYFDNDTVIRCAELVLGGMTPIAPQPKTGRWIRWYEQKEYDGGIYHIPHCSCSECSKEYDPHSSQFIKYCCECGAKMTESEVEK